MRKLEMAEIKERQEELDLTSTFVYNIEKGRVELYHYQTGEEKDSLLKQDWCYSSDNDQVIGLRINGAKIVEENKDLEDEQLQLLKEQTHMKIYKGAESFLPHDAVKCGESYERATHQRAKYVGTSALLGDYLMVKIDGLYYRFKENDHSYVGRW